MRNASARAAIITPSVSHGQKNREVEDWRDRNRKRDSLQSGTLGRIAGMLDVFRETSKLYVINGCLAHPSMRGNCTCSPEQRRNRIGETVERLRDGLVILFDGFHCQWDFLED